MIPAKDSRNNEHRRHEHIVATVMTRIERRRLSRARWSAAGTGALSAFSLAAFIPAASYAWTTAERSGFFSYVSLVASDGGILMHSWQDLAWSMISAAPFVGGALCLGLVFVLGLCARSFARALSAVSAYRQLLAA